MHENSGPAELPSPDPQALATSRALLQRIGVELGAGRNLGGGGVFAPAPDLSPLFGRALARQVAQLLQPGDAILEFGAGSGALAASVLNEVSVPYFVLETSPELRQRQRQRLGDGVQWLDRLPERFRGVMLANEVV